MFKIKKKNKNIVNYDNFYFKEKNNKKKIFFIFVTTFISLFSCLFYFLIKNDILVFSKNSNYKEPLKIVIPYSNNYIDVEEYNVLKYKIKQGDTLSNILNNEIEIDFQSINKILNSLNKIFDISTLKINQIIEIKYKTLIYQNKNNEISEKNILEELKIDDFQNNYSYLVSLKNNDYISKKTSLSLNKNFVKYKVKITDSLYNDGIKAGISSNIMLEFIKMYSFDIDFQRDIHKDDEFEILYEIYSTQYGERIKDGSIFYTNLTTSNRKIEMYKYNINGIDTYFDKNGKSVQKSLLKTPINGARISSAYGVRKHPILGYSKMHKGVDFAAPTGTPIYAAGSGTVEKAELWTSWGNYIRISHTKEYDTEYAHMSKIANGIRKGVKVRQGQIIGYVGSTGRSTGPHLHYGVFYKNERINPNRLKTLPSINLTGENLANFKKEVNKIDTYRFNIVNQKNNY